MSSELDKTVIDAFRAWLELNGCRNAKDAIELMEGSNDNPNIRPLPEGKYQMSTSTDSRVETRKHIHQVQSLMAKVMHAIAVRSEVHDASKLESPEVEAFDEFTPKLAGSTYGSDEYKAFLAAMKPALDHHYAHNSHHPEHFAFRDPLEGGELVPSEVADGTAIRRMSLLDLIEMVCDWKAATLRHNNGDLAKSIEMNQKRFGYSDELKAILVNTARELGMFDRSKP